MEIKDGSSVDRTKIVEFLPLPRKLKAFIELSLALSTGGCTAVSPSVFQLFSQPEQPAIVSDLGTPQNDIGFSTLPAPEQRPTPVVIVIDKVPTIAQAKTKESPPPSPIPKDINAKDEEAMAEALKIIEQAKKEGGYVLGVTIKNQRTRISTGKIELEKTYGTLVLDRFYIDLKTLLRHSKFKPESELRNKLHNIGLTEDQILQCIAKANSPMTDDSDPNKDLRFMYPNLKGQMYYWKFTVDSDGACYWKLAPDLKYK